jgi:hypothetical protein
MGINFCVFNILDNTLLLLCVGDIAAIDVRVFE